MAKEVRTEDTRLINSILNVNDTKKSRPSSSRNFLKTIGAKVFGNVTSNELSLTNEENDGYPSITDVFNLENGTIVQDKLAEFRTLSINRYRQYATYEQMSEDPVISSALDMYADDATQTDKNGDRIWVQSDDAEMDKILQGIFKPLDLEDKIWKIARMLAQYGDVYLELFYDKNPKSEVTLLEKNLLERNRDYTNKLEEVDKLVHNKSDGYIINDYRIVPDIENMFDLRVNDKTVAFARILESDTMMNTQTGYISPTSTASDIRYYPPDKFVHIYLDQSERTDSDYYVVDLGNGKQFRFEVARGKSMIHDVFRTQRDLQLLEYSIMLNRVGKSSIFRFVKVEVGNMSKSNVDVTLRKVKNLIENKVTMNTNDGTFKPYSDPGPLENYVYIPVKNGQGNITIDTVGGDVNLRDIADLDYFNNKLFAGLKIPKSFLNFENTLASFGGGGALTKQDARYARTIKRLQGFIIKGITRFIDIILENRGLSYILDEYEVRMVTPSSVEDEERDTLFSNRLELIKSFNDVINSLSESDNVNVNMQKLIDYLSDEILNDSDLKDILIVSKSSPASDSVEAAGGGPIDNDLDFGGGSFGGDGASEFSELGGGLENVSSPEMNESPEEPSATEDFSGEWNDLEP